VGGARESPCDAYNLPVNLWRLECFVVVARELHFGRAAKALHVSQPALSSQIKLLEEEVGAPLLDRAGGVTLTPVGEALLPEATAILDAVAAMMERVRALTGRVVGQLNVHFTRSVQAAHSLGLVQQFERTYPEVDVLMQSQWTSLNVEALREGRADVAFVRLPLEDSDGVEVLSMGSHQQLVAMPADHRLAALDFIHDSDLEGERLITWRREDAPGNFDRLLARWAEAGPTLSVPMPDVAHRLARAATTGELTLISDFAVSDLPEQLVARPLMPPLYSEWGLAWRFGTSNPLVRRFIELAKPSDQG
jgi:DNA-binding transcriptional LysR family regulator